MTALKTYLSGRVVVKVGDITKETVDAIVNAANGIADGRRRRGRRDSPRRWTGDQSGLRGNSPHAVSAGLAHRTRR